MFITGKDIEFSNLKDYNLGSRCIYKLKLSFDLGLTDRRPVATKLTNQVNNQSLIPSTDALQLTLTLKMTTVHVVETSVTDNNSPIQDYIHSDDHIPPIYDK